MLNDGNYIAKTTEIVCKTQVFEDFSREILEKEDIADN